MTNPDLVTDADTAAYEPPSITRVGSLSDLTRNGQRSNSDSQPFQADTAFGPES